jgi:hypothetical protein
MPDTQLAKALQVTSQCVGKRRRALGIPQYINPESADRTKLISDDVLQLLGTMSDSKLAKQLGLEPGHVRYRRVQAEIPVFQANSKVSEEMRSVLGTMSDEAIA